MHKKVREIKENELSLLYCERDNTNKCFFWFVLICEQMLHSSFDQVNLDCGKSTAEIMPQRQICATPLCLTQKCFLIKKKKLCWAQSARSKEPFIGFQCHLLWRQFVCAFIFLGQQWWENLQYLHMLFIYTYVQLFY